jgi:hypothetical protein
MRPRTILLLASLAVPFVTASVARAQGSVSASDRQLARAQYTKGYESQQAGRFAEALDSFQRSFDLFNAPTTALHIAECQAALGKIVEASETYRGVAKLQLDATAPAEFQHAKDQAAAELAQIEPRIPTLTIRVTPTPPNLNVSLDGQIVKSASLGLPRTVNPGVHKIVAVAPGYLQAEQSIEIKERTTPTVALTLQAGAVTYTPVGPGTGTGPGPTGPTTGPTTGPGWQQGGGNTGWQPQGGNTGWQQAGGTGFSNEWTKPPRRNYSRMSLLFGAKFQVLVPTGKVFGTADMSSFAGAGAGGGGEIAFRFGRFFLLGVDIEGGAFAPAGGFNATPSTFFIGPYLGYIDNPDGVGFYGEIGGGYRQASGVGTGSAYGGDFLLGLGLHIRAGSYLRLIPKVTASMGAFSNTDRGPIIDMAPHFIFGFGLTGFFDVDLDKPPPAPPATPPAATPANIH